MYANFRQYGMDVCFQKQNKINVSINIWPVKGIVQWILRGVNTKLK